MDRLVNITLITQLKTKDSIGEEIITETSKTIRGELSSVTRDEWFTAQRADINAKSRVKVYDFEYNDEVVAELNGTRYAIYRTYYAGGDKIELYLGEKGSNLNG